MLHKENLWIDGLKWEIAWQKGCASSTKLTACFEFGKRYNPDKHVGLKQVVYVIDPNLGAVNVNFKPLEMRAYEI